MFSFKNIVVTALLMSLAAPALFGQLSSKELAGQMNAIQSAVPFLTIAPDSRAGAMGDAGVATDPDINSMHWNPAKYAFIDEEMGISLSYTPWLRTLVPDINLAYLSFFRRLDRQQVIAASLRYFSLGEIVFTNQFGDYQGQHTPNEFAIDAGYSRLFSDKFSGGLAFRFIRSDLTGGAVSSTSGETKAGIAFAADVSAYYQTDIQVSDKDAKLSFGADISNIGTKISYTQNQDADFIPINLRLGGALKMNLDPYNTLTFALDFNKLLVPSPPVYYQDSTNAAGDPVIHYGMDPNVSVPVGMFRSFYDAPGGFKEEINEIMYSIGAEYWYRNQFAIRGGYFHENQNKGNRKFFTLGVGLKLNVFAVDFAYLVPTSGRQNPLANTMRFTLSFNFDKYKNQNAGN